MFQEIAGAIQAARGVADLINGPGYNYTNANQSFQQNLANANYEHSKEFAQNSIQWRVADAKAAGLHPLAALGAASASYTPSSYIPGDDRGSSDDHVGRGLENMGQGVGRIAASMQSKGEREESAFEMISKSQAIQRGDLENQILASKLALMRQGAGPSAPTIAGGSLGPHKMEPYEVVTGQPDSPGVAAGPPAPSSEVRSANVPHRGAVETYPAKGLNIDDLTSPGWASWMWNNAVMPFFSNKYGTPAKSQLPRGAIGWQHHMGTWYPVYPSSDRQIIKKIGGNRIGYSGE